jgi:hypothetical protein
MAHGGPGAEENRARDAAAQQEGHDGHKSTHLDNFLERPR